MPRRPLPSRAEPVRGVQGGAGAMGRSWLSLLRDSDQVELVGLVDLDSEAARRAAEAAGHRGVAVAGTLEELLRQGEADAVLNVTTPSAHREVSITALLAGL